MQGFHLTTWRELAPNASRNTFADLVSHCHGLKRSLARFLKGRDETFHMGRTPVDGRDRARDEMAEEPRAQNENAAPNETFTDSTYLTFRKL